MSARTVPESDRIIGAARTSLPSQLLHDLRAPLNQIIGYSEMLTEEAEGQRREDFMSDLERIGAAGHRMLAVIEENFTSDQNANPIAIADEREPLQEPAVVSRHPAAAPGLLLVVDDDATNRAA